MQTRFLLLRLLLCASLIVNGVATAFAGAASGLAQHEAMTQSMPSPPHPSACHDAPAADIDQTGHDGAPGHPSEGNCCAGLACLAHCLGCGQAALNQVAWIWAAPPAIAPQAPGAGQHRPPAIPHLLRPPIG